MRAFILLGVIVLCANSINIDQVVFAEMNEKLSSLSTSASGKFILELASMHAEVRGPLEDLVAAIQSLVNDSQDELNLLDANFQRHSNEHVRDVNALEQTIGEAQIDVANAQDGLDSYLQPSKEALEARIEQLRRNIESNRDSLQRETVQRNNDKASFEERVKEHQSVLEALDKALGLVAQLQNNPSSFAQTASITNSLKQIESHLKKRTEFAPMIEALLDLAQNFSDQGVVKQLVQMLSDLRNNVVDSMNLETADETERQSQWTQRQQALNSEHLEFQRGVAESTVQLDAIQERIASESDFLSNRQQDLATFQEQLNLENDTFSSEQQIYQETRQQILEDIAVAQKAYEFITSAQFTDYITSRINKNIV